MEQPENDFEALHYKVTNELNSSKLFDVPDGRHRSLIEEFSTSKDPSAKDDYEKQLLIINDHWRNFEQFTMRQEAFKSSRLGAERQAFLEPKRVQTAIDELNNLGYEVTRIGTTEINFTYKGSVIKYFPYSGWASGKTIQDGRGLRNLLDQIEPADNTTEQ